MTSAVRVTPQSWPASRACVVEGHDLDFVRSQQVGEACLSAPIAPHLSYDAGSNELRVDLLLARALVDIGGCAENREPC